MSFDYAIRAKDLGKCYQIYRQPLDRLRQSFWRGKKKFYQEFWALKDITLNIGKGDTVGIIGSNGSGKSTLLQLICGTLNPTEGYLEVYGRIAALLELGAGFNPEYTGRENVYMNAAIMGISRSEIELRYDKIAAFADIGSFIEQPVKTYSSGMYVRLAFATAINVSPDILLVDEALSVGDVRFQQKCMAKIREFCQSGTVIFVTHDTTAVIELCSRVFWIESGKIRLEGMAKSVVEKYLQYMYEGDAKPHKSTINTPRPLTDGFDTREFRPVSKDIRQFGNHRVVIDAVRLRSRNINTGVIYSGTACEIGMLLHARHGIADPILGFIVKDRLGREVFGDNTSLMQARLEPFSTGKKYIVTFQLDAWPNLFEGDYTLSLAVADGTMDSHDQCHWLHDVLVIKSIPARPAVGIFSITGTKVASVEMD